eukprot:gene15754-35872_t
MGVVASLQGLQSKAIGPIIAAALGPHRLPVRPSARLPSSVPLPQTPDAPQLGTLRVVPPMLQASRVPLPQTPGSPPLGTLPAVSPLPTPSSFVSATSAKLLVAPEVAPQQSPRASVRSLKGLASRGVLTQAP